MVNNYFLEEIKSLPALISPCLIDFDSRALELANLPQLVDLEKVYLVGCGDSYHAGLCSEMFFRQVTGLDCRALTSMAFSRYESGFLANRPEKALVIALSSSGNVSRTIEALELADEAGAFTAAFTSNENSPLAISADYLFHIRVLGIFDTDESIIVPGCRSFFASLLALFSTAAQLVGGDRGNRGSLQLEQILDADLIMEQITKTISSTEDGAREAAADWQDKDYFVFCGAGPSYGAACYSAAKIL